MAERIPKLDEGRLQEIETGLRMAMDDSVQVGMADILITYLSEVFTCDRIYIIEKNAHGGYDNTHEWCRVGIPHKKAFLQNLSHQGVSPYYQRFRENELLLVRDMEELRESDAELYALLRPQGLTSFLVGHLGVSGGDLGFFGIDNPGEKDMYVLSIFFRSIRNFLSMMLDSRSLGGHPQAYAPELPGDVGNWHQLWQAAGELSHEQSVGLVTSNVIDMLGRISRHGMVIADSELVEVGRAFAEVFGREHVFRISGDDFVVLVGGCPRHWFAGAVQELETRLGTLGVSIELSSLYEDIWQGDFHDLYRRCRESMRPLELSEEIQ